MHFDCERLAPSFQLGATNSRHFRQMDIDCPRDPQLGDDCRVGATFALINGHWHCGVDQLTDTGTAADFDAWNHLQLALDTARKTYRVSLQVKEPQKSEVGQG